MLKYKITYNQSRRTYTVRVYNENGKRLAKYRSFPQGINEFGPKTENEIRSLLENGEFYKIE